MADFTNNYNTSNPSTQIPSCTLLPIHNFQAKHSTINSPFLEIFYGRVQTAQNGTSGRSTSRKCSTGSNCWPFTRFGHFIKTDGVSASVLYTLKHQLLCPGTTTLLHALCCGENFYEMFYAHLSSIRNVVFPTIRTIAKYLCCAERIMLLTVSERKLIIRRNPLMKKNMLELQGMLLIQLLLFSFVFILSVPFKQIRLVSFVAGPLLLAATWSGLRSLALLNTNLMLQFIAFSIGLGASLSIFCVVLMAMGHHYIALIPLSFGSWLIYIAYSMKAIYSFVRDVDCNPPHDSFILYHQNNNTTNNNSNHNNNINPASPNGHDLELSNPAFVYSPPAEAISDHPIVRCCVCLVAETGAAFLPCGHVCCCMPCAMNLKFQSADCPICRASFAQVIKVVVS